MDAAVDVGERREDVKLPDDGVVLGIAGVADGIPFHWTAVDDGFRKILECVVLRAVHGEEHHIKLKAELALTRRCLYNLRAP